MDGGIPTTDISEVGLEVLHVAWIETDDGCVEADVCLCDCGSKIIWARARGEVGFDAVKGNKELLDIPLVCFLGTISHFSSQLALFFLLNLQIGLRCEPRLAVKGKNTS
jgi:hypothetical protein